MARKTDYSSWLKEDLIKRIEALEKHKKYGLVWDKERAKEIFEEEADGQLPVLREVKSKEIKTAPNSPSHILIEGDNYHALSVLNYTHEKAVDLIYIDPPYNTGNKDFIFNDRYVDKEDGYRHSKWLSFMAKRLRLARNILKDEGLFFISIDDNEYAQLKLLCDEIFGESNFKNSIVVARVKKNIRERRYVKSLNIGHGFLLLYGNSQKAEVEIPTRLQKKEERWHAFDAPGIRPTMEYELFGQKPPPGRHWMYSEDRAKEMSKKGRLRPNPKTGKPQYKLAASNLTMIDTNWTDIQEGDSKWKFENSEKNVDFIKRIISMHYSKKCIIVDFFAGSGTTGHAVFEINKEDGGRRQFIICTNNENNICDDFTYPRMVKILNGYKTQRGKEILGFANNLKYYRTSFVPSQPTDRNKELLTKQSVEMLCLRENTFDFVSQTDEWKIFRNHEKYTGIIFDQLSIPEFKKDIANIEKPISVYVFSLGDDDFAPEFEDMQDKVKVCSIPEAILRVYRRIFR